MVTVVNLNPCFDWSWHINHFTRGGMNRVTQTRTDIAGKGLNVCFALKNLGLDPFCTGFHFTQNGAEIITQLNNAGILHDFINVDAPTRVNIKLYDAAGEMTELNQPGAYVSNAAQDTLVKKIMTRAQSGKSDILVLSGSRPVNVPADFYARLCAAWPGRVILDTEGEALRLAIGYNTPAPPLRVPFLIKPNLFELESTFGVTLSSHDAIINFARVLIGKGVHIVCVSMGAQGALLISKDETHYAPPLSVDVKAVQGAGDAMVAGLIHGMRKDKLNHIALDYMLRCAVAAATATITREGTQMCDATTFNHYFDACKFE
ncbi:MAG: 1-phosphofructokinase family hexose kinase [Defluviitaleaceae bacterium]|nr:1-phosphofructokinase family hexose kinase [Defluviitaleaceae bacterium]